MTSANPAVATRGRHTARTIAIVVGLVLAVLVALLATREPAQNTVAASQLDGKPAPAVTATTLDGEQVSLEQYRGQYVVLNFFASWCVPCQREHPELIRFSQRHEAAGDAQVVAVVFSDDPDNAREFFRKHGGDWPVLVDPQGQVALDYGVRGPPESFLIDPDGYVLTRIVGEVDDAGLERLLAQAKELRGS